MDASSTSFVGLISRVLGWLWSALVAPHPKRWLPRIVTFVLSWMGWALAFSWIASVHTPMVAVRFGALFAGIAAVASARPSGRTRYAVYAVRVFITGASLVFVYLAIAIGTFLAWSLPWLVVGTALGLLAGWIWTTRQGWPSARVPLVLPVGLWIAVCLVGWCREDGVVRCDDYQRMRADPRISLIMPSTVALNRCEPGGVLKLGRYPRHIWEAPDSSRFVFTTQPGINRFWPAGEATADTPTGSICEVPADGSKRPTCLGQGKAQGMAESESLNRLFFAAWGIPTGDPRRNGRRGAVYVVPRQGPLELVGEVRDHRQMGELFYDPQADLVGVLTDEYREMVPVRASTLKAGPPVTAPFCGEMRYDPVRHEGMVCAAMGRLMDGEAFAAVAIRGKPFSYRPLARSSIYPSTWVSFSEGCDWDPETRRAWVSIASLGILGSMDYDTGLYTARQFIGFGYRTIVHDRQRERLYLANFLRGDVIALDLKTHTVVAEWFVGRFVRHLVVSRDGSALLATSNVGLMKIALPRLDDRAHAPASPRRW